MDSAPKGEWMYGSTGGPGVRAAVAVAGAALLLAGCSSARTTAAARDGHGRRRDHASSPRRPDPYWVNPDGNAARQVAAYAKDGKDEDAELIRKIAEQPAGEWIGPDEPGGRGARASPRRPTKADRDALLVLYNIPHRDCGQFSQGGAADGNAYRAWIDGVAKGIGDRRATVILEPDAVLHLVDGCTPAGVPRGAVRPAQGRRRAGSKRLPNTKVYLDAGNAGWRSPRPIFEPLRRAGIDKADGFAVNVSNFYTTADSARTYGKQLSAKVGGKPFVIDTSRNGNGPYTGGDPDENWCNPPGRALGETPTTDDRRPAGRRVSVGQAPGRVGRRRARAARRRASGGRSTRWSWRARQVADVTA